MKVDLSRYRKKKPLFTEKELAKINLLISGKEATGLHTHRTARVIDKYTRAEVDAKLAAQDEFTELTDTPDDYSGEGGKGVRVKGDESGLEFYSAVSDTDEKTKVSSNDTTAGYLNGKLVAGTGISLTENNDGGDETLTIAHDMQEVLAHTDLSDMPDSGGTNSDHDGRYYTKAEVLAFSVAL